MEMSIHSVEVLHAHSLQSQLETTDTLCTMIYVHLQGMGGGDRCCVGGCDNDRRKPEKWVVKSHVSYLQWHSFPSDEKKKKDWEINIGKGLEAFTAGTCKKVCSNHFVDARPTEANPHPTLSLVASDKRKSPRKRRTIQKAAGMKKVKCSLDTPQDPENTEDQPPPPPLPSLTFAHLTRECDVRLHTGFKNADMFRLVFQTVENKARRMQYWKGQKQTLLEARNSTVAEEYKRPGPKRALSREQEFLMVMMRLRMGLSVEDVSFRFQVATGLASSVFQTWIRLMRKELSWLIIWPSKAATKKNLPSCFQKWYANVRCIIDCTEVFIETPSSLDVQAQCYSEYKHHTTIKILIAINPNGLITYVSDCYGGRASDKFIVKDCGFLDLIEPYDEVMADRGFKIRDDLMTRMASLAIPPSTRTGMQMTSAEVSATSRLANVRIYVEQAIGRMKWFRILSNEMPMLLLPNCDDIIVTCCALCNLLDPLCI